MRSIIALFIIQAIHAVFSDPSWLVVPGYDNQYYPEFEIPVRHVRQAIVMCAEKGGILAVCYDIAVRTYFRHYLKMNNRKYSCNHVSVAGLLH